MQERRSIVFSARRRMIKLLLNQFMRKTYGIGVIYISVETLFVGKTVQGVN